MFHEREVEEESLCTNCWGGGGGGGGGGARIGCGGTADEVASDLPLGGRNHDDPREELPEAS